MLRPTRLACGHTTGAGPIPKYGRPAGPLKYKWIKDFGKIDHFSGKFEDQRDYTGIGRQKKPVQAINRRAAFTENDDSISPNLKSMEQKIAKSLSETVNPVSLKMSKDEKKNLSKFTSVNHTRVLRPFLNKGLDHLHVAQEGRHVSVTSSTFPERTTINQDMLAQKLLSVHPKLKVGDQIELIPGQKETVKDPNIYPKADELSDIFPGPGEEIHGSLLPFDLQAGVVTQDMNEKPSRFGNIELTKSTHFMHLTPVAMRKHCNELKEFMTEFPEELKAVMKTKRVDDAKKFQKRAFNLSSATKKVVKTKNSGDKKANKLIENSDELPIILKTTDYLSSRSIMADPRAQRAEMRVSLNSLDLTPSQKMKLIDLIQIHEDEATRGYQPIQSYTKENKPDNAMGNGRTPGLSGEVVCRFDPVSECIHFQSSYLPTRLQNIDFIVNTLKNLYQFSVAVHDFEKSTIYDTKNNAVWDKSEFDHEMKLKQQRYNGYSNGKNFNQKFYKEKILSKPVDVPTMLNNKDHSQNKLGQLEQARQNYEEYTQNMYQLFNIENKISRKDVVEIRSFCKDDPQPVRYPQMNEWRNLGKDKWNYWHKDGNMQFNLNIGDI